MSTKIVKTDQCKTECKLHHLPCKIKFDGKSDIGGYFHPTNDGDKLSAAFRGRPLDGKEINFNKELVGVVMEVKESDTVDNAPTELKAIGEFNTMTEWYLGSKFASAQAIATTCDIWPMSVAPAIHGIIQ